MDGAGAVGGCGRRTDGTDARRPSAQLLHGYAYCKRNSRATAPCVITDRYKTITLGTGHSAHYANYANHTQYSQYDTTEPPQNVNPSSSLHIQ